MSSKTIAGSAALVCAWMMAAGCGSGDETEIPPSPYETEAGFCGKLAEAVCNSTVTELCYQSDSSTLEDDKASCVALASERAFCNPNGYVYRRDGAEACVAATKAAYADGKLNLEELDAADEACIMAFSGNGAVGDSCSADHQCNAAAGLRCLAKPGLEGTCQEPEEVSAGTDCPAAHQVCEEGFYCDDQVQVCRQLKAVGDACSEVAPCVEEARCVNDVCEEKASNGATCTEAVECQGGFCNEGRCGANITLSPSSDACLPLLP